MNEELTVLLAELNEQEQDAAKLLKSARAAKADLLREEEEMAALEQQLQRQAFAEQLKQSPTDMKTLGVSYRQLHTMTSRHSTLRILRVHSDIEKLLTAALPSESEQSFYQLVSALASYLAGTYTNVRGRVSELKVAEATSRYFGSFNGVSIAIAVSGKAASCSSELLEDLVTAYALEWGKSTQYDSE